MTEFNTKEILELLNNDIVSHGVLEQWISRSNGFGTCTSADLKNVLHSLLSSGDVEIGFAQSKDPNYVEFVAWKGTVDDKVQRALRKIEASNKYDKEFAYWICLPANIDRTEEDDLG